MTKQESAIFEERTLDDLTIDDDRSFRHIGLYEDLKEVLRRAKYRFRILPASQGPRPDRALLLNLTFWGADAGGDILVGDHIDADVVAHAAWHHLSARATAPAHGERPSVDALFLGETIASAFDVYLVGRLLAQASRSTFLEAKVSAMAEVAQTAGLGEDDFERLLQGIAEDPDRAFVDLREILFDAMAALLACRNAEEGYAALAAFDGHRFAALLHHYELSNWVLYARAYGCDDGQARARARSIDLALREEKAPLDWLEAKWVAPALDLV